MNYFQLFDLNQSFTLDLSLLRHRYQALQRVTHPDRFATSPEHEKALAVQKNALVSDGFYTLSHPLRRAEHLLQLNGVCLSHESQTLQDREFLFKQMELRETLDDIRVNQDGDQSFGIVSSEVFEMSKQFNGDLKSKLEMCDWLGAADVVRKLKFLEKVTIEIERLEDELDDL